LEFWERRMFFDPIVTIMCDNFVEITNIFFEGFKLKFNTVCLAGLMNPAFRKRKRLGNNAFRGYKRLNYPDFQEGKKRTYRLAPNEFSIFNF
jgi:hypothetical protein